MKKILLFTFLIFCFVSCGITKFEQTVNRLELGMTKQEVISLMGQDYTSMGALTTLQGNIESWCYNVYSQTYPIINLNFLNGRLVEWFRETPDKAGVEPKALVVDQQ